MLTIVLRKIFSSHATAVFVAAIVGIGFSVDANAQFGGGMGRQRGGQTQEGRNTAHAQSRDQAANVGQNRSDAESYELIEYRLSLLEGDLRVTPEQDALWRAFAERTRAYAADIARERAQTAIAQNSASGGTNKSALAFLGETVNRMRDRLTAMEDIEVAAKALLAGLNESQRALFDARVASIFSARRGGEVSAAGRDNGRELPRR